MVDKELILIDAICVPGMCWCTDLKGDCCRIISFTCSTGLFAVGGRFSSRISFFCSSCHPCIIIPSFLDCLLLGSISCIDCKMLHHILFMYLNENR
ncbi:hypothetical protein Peur_012986 [Populus x canadensis]